MEFIEKNNIVIIAALSIFHYSKPFPFLTLQRSKINYFDIFNNKLIIIEKQFLQISQILTLLA
jgi:hypothetical protein